MLAIETMNVKVVEESMVIQVFLFFALQIVQVNVQVKVDVLTEHVDASKDGQEKVVIKVLITFLNIIVDDGL